ncbi:MAG TPA: hypothetical protein VN281_00990 [Verrucomicrobiae bacterium]|jgi:hypothetical protein|nr:hypothetical protein [Verrucomicrobiae bacterium]
MWHRYHGGRLKFVDDLWAAISHEPTINGRILNLKRGIRPAADYRNLGSQSQAGPHEFLPFATAISKQVQTSPEHFRTDGV